MRMWIILLLVAVALGIALFVTRDRTLLRLMHPAASVSEVHDIPYVTGGGHKQQLDLYLPQNAANIPMVLFVHGGYWTSGDRNYVAPATGLYGSVGRALAGRGIGVAVMSYRLVPEATVEQQIQDVRSAFVWLRAHAAEHGGNPARVFLMGHSAGAHLVNMLTSDRTYLEAVGMSPKDIRGTITLSGIVDLVHMRDANDADFNERVTFRVFGTEEAALVRYTPGTHVGSDTPPFLILLGENDFPYLFPETEAAVAKLRGFGHAPEYAVVRGNRHMDMVLQLGARSDNVTEHVVSFIERRR